MKPSALIVKQLRTLEFPEAFVREMRALFVAQAVAYQVPLDATKSAEELVVQHEPVLLTILNEVNEFLPVDIKLARSQFRRLIAGRLALINGVSDTTLLVAALNSASQAGEFSTDAQQLVRALTSQPSFGGAQIGLSAALADALIATQTAE